MVRKAGELGENVTAGVQSITDTFRVPCKEGGVVGTVTDGGIRRGGSDREGVMSIDNGALRIRPMAETGWGSAGVSYGPYSRQNGLALAVYMLNGHNTSQVQNLEETLRERLWRWFIGSETYTPAQRLLQFVKSGRMGRMVPQVRWWMRIRRHAKPVQLLDENLAVGWFTKEVPEAPLSEGNAFVMHATGSENGELWANIGSNPLPAIRSIQNLQIYYVVILREKGAAYYAGSIPDANGLTAFPNMRPLAIDPFNEQPLLYPGIHQSALGQIGFRLDTRVYGARVELLPEFSRWFGSAHAADMLIGRGSLGHSGAEAGGLWRMVEGDFGRGAEGTVPLQANNLALLETSIPAGLVHVVCTLSDEAAAAGVIWRFQDAENYWRLRVSSRGCQLSIKESGVWKEVAQDPAPVPCGGASSIQLLDDGRNMSFYRDGALLLASRFQDERLKAATGVGLFAEQTALLLRQFEAHPRAVALPDTVRMGEPWLRSGDQVVIADDFRAGECEIEGRTTSLGGKVWRKQLGTGTMRLNGEGGVKIQASPQRPNPDRTAYLVDWDHPEFMDVSIEITPPGTGPGQKEHGLCGLMIWQDADNYITINIWLSQAYAGASISCFFHLDGFEDLYDAIWANVGKRVYYGRPFQLRVVFDGIQYMVYVDGEPVLYRALRDVYPDYPRFSINRVGLLSNWEWGNDTGSTFRDFVGKI